MHPCPAPKCRGWDGNPPLIDTALCQWHTGKTLEAINELPRLYVQLAISLGDTHATIDTETRHTKAAAAPLPINTQARALQEDMLHITRTAEIAYRQAAHFSTVNRGGREAVVLAARCDFLARHHEGILTHNVTVGLEVLRIKHSSRAILGLTKIVHRLHAPCPECDCLGLVRDNGSSYVECRACGIVFDEDRYGLLTRVLASDIPTQPAREPRPHLAAQSDGVGW